jgi:hypothetical protein
MTKRKKDAGEAKKTTVKWCEPNKILITTGYPFYPAVVWALLEKFSEEQHLLCRVYRYPYQKM